MAGTGTLQIYQTSTRTNLSREARYLRPILLIINVLLLLNCYCYCRLQPQLCFSGELATTYNGSATFNFVPLACVFGRNDALVMMALAVQWRFVRTDVVN